jgi:hypothetical protein
MNLLRKQEQTERRTDMQSCVAFTRIYYYYGYYIIIIAITIITTLSRDGLFQHIEKKDAVTQC